MVDISPRPRTIADGAPAWIEWNAAAVALTIAVPARSAPYLAGFSTPSGPALTMPEGIPLADVLLVSRGHSPASDRLVHGSIGETLRYAHHETHSGPDGDRLDIACECDVPGLSLVVSFFAASDSSVVRSEVTVTNAHETMSITLRAVPSFSSYFGSPDARVPDPHSWVLTRGRNDWLGEGRWISETLDSRILPDVAAELTDQNPRGSVTFSSQSTWSTGQHLPVAVVESEAFGAAWAWQIEHNGPWRWEVGEDNTDAYLALSGPTDLDHQFTRVLLPGESFRTVPAAVTVAADFDGAMAALTRYRRATRRPHADNTSMPVIFNDYMNTLDGDPTTEKLLPLVDAAAEIGADIFCVDAGWYDDGGDWWNSVGAWAPSTTRFPNGLAEVVDRISARGMTAGLWLEPEVVGVESPTARSLPDSAFLSRHGERIVEHERYLLDLRHPAARAHVDEVVDRLVRDFEIGYFKLDYNVTPGAGTDLSADSVGSGLLEHNRAHLAWLDSVLDRHPQVVLENCASGAMRSDFAMLSRLQLQSTSDQQDPIKYPPIAASAPMMMLPEQAASWAYPQPSMTMEESAFALTTGMMGRFFVSGHLNKMDDTQRALVAEAVTAAKSLAPHIRISVPSWPLGLPGWDDDVVALELAADGLVLIAIWDRRGSARTSIPVQRLRATTVDPTTVFPRSLDDWTVEWDPHTATLSIENLSEEPAARVLALVSPKG